MICKCGTADRHASRPTDYGMLFTTCHVCGMVEVVKLPVKPEVDPDEPEVESNEVE